jgi:hypothetical protein
MTYRIHVNGGEVFEGDDRVIVFQKAKKLVTEKNTVHIIDYGRINPMTIGLWENGRKLR